MSAVSRATITYACRECGTSGPQGVLWACPVCAERHTEAVVAERCAPLVEFAARFCQHVDDGHQLADGMFWRRVAADALAAYHAAQGAGRETEC